MRCVVNWLSGILIIALSVGAAMADPQGPTGRSGPRGALLHGSGAPASGLGIDGDFYLDITGHQLYGPKAAGAWPDSPIPLAGSSMLERGSGTLGMVRPQQTSAGASKIFGTSDLFRVTRRSNDGRPMRDTLPVAAATGMANGAWLSIVNDDPTATLTLTAGGGTSLCTLCGSVGPGRELMLVYDQPTSTWRATANSERPAVAAVSSTAALQALPVSAFPDGVMRLGFAARGDSPPVMYLPTGSACSLNTGNGDGGSQIRSADGKCWVWIPPMEPSPLIFGCKGDGVADDTSCMQLAINATAGVRLYLGRHLYKVSATLRSSSTVTIRGAADRTGIYERNCYSGFKAASNNLSVLVLTGSGSSVRNVCFQMSNDPSENSAGTALTFGVGTQFTAAGNQFLFCFVCVDVTGNGRKQNVATHVDSNVFRGMADGGAAIRVGLKSTGGSTVDTRISNNSIIQSSSNTAAGLMLLDSGGAIISYNDIFQLGYGTRIYPGANQHVEYVTAAGVLGDTSYVNDLYIDTAHSTAVVRLNAFNGTWTSSAPLPLRIANTSGGTIETQKFVGHRTIASANTVKWAVSIEGGNSISFDGGQFCANTDLGRVTALRIGSSVSGIRVRNNDFDACGGTMGKGIDVARGANVIVLTNNSIATPGTAMTVGTFEALTAIITANIGIDNIVASITAAPTLNLPLNPTVHVSGTTTVTTINGAWSGRRVTLVATHPSGFTSKGGAGSVCATKRFIQNVPVSLTWDGALGCWLVH